MKSFYLTIIAISCSLSTTIAFAQENLPTVEQVKMGVRLETREMDCTKIINKFSSEALPGITKAIINPEERKPHERQWSAAILEEITNQIKIKCTK